MKTLLSAILLATVPAVLPAQTGHNPAAVHTLSDVPAVTAPIPSSQHVSYTYDAAGNRLARILVLQSSARKGTATDRIPDGQPDPLQEQFGERTVTIYPNPTQGHLVVHVTGGKSSLPIGCRLYDMQGTLLLQQSLDSDQMNELDLSELQPGIYFLNLYTDGSSVQYKIIKK